MSMFKRPSVNYPRTSVTYKEMNDVLLDAIEHGAVYAETGPGLSTTWEAITLHPDDPADVQCYRLEFVPNSPRVEIKQTSLEIERFGGVFRSAGLLHAGLLRRSVHLDCSPLEVQKGDMLALRVDDQTIYTTQTIVRLTAPR